MSERPLHHSEVAKHADKDSLWVIVNGNAYDLTECEWWRALALRQ